jgi:hypothetical protein
MSKSELLSHQSSLVVDRLEILVWETMFQTPPATEMQNIYKTQRNKELGISTITTRVDI